MYPNQPQSPVEPPQQPNPYGSQPPQPGTVPAPAAPPAYSAPPQPAAPPAFVTPQTAAQPQPTMSQPLGYAPQPSTPLELDPRIKAQPTFAVDYLDQIAPPPARPSFFSGSFGRILVVLAIVFILAVSIIVAFSGKDRTADLEKLVTRLDDFSTLVQQTKINLVDQKLTMTNTNFQGWINSTDYSGHNLLSQAGVTKTQMDKTMVAAEKLTQTSLASKFSDAKLNAQLDQVYANEMAYQSELMITMLNTMARTSGAKPIRDYAKNASSQLVPIQKDFAKFHASSVFGN